MLCYIATQLSGSEAEADNLPGCIMKDTPEPIFGPAQEKCTCGITQYKELGWCNVATYRLSTHVQILTFYDDLHTMNAC